MVQDSLLVYTSRLQTLTHFLVSRNPRLNPHRPGRRTKISAAGWQRYRTNAYAASIP
jgi:hypothetical protein